MKEILYILFSFAALTTHAQISFLEVEIGGGYNHAISDLDLEGSATIHGRIIAGYKLSDQLTLSSGFGLMDSETTGIKDYSPLFPGDSQNNGTADTLNSYYQIGNDRSSIIVPLMLGYSFKRYVISAGIETVINIRSDLKSYLIESGENKTVSEYNGPKSTWQENNVNLALTLEFGIGLLKSQRLRLTPRIRYQLNPTDINNHAKLREIYTEIGVGYRLWQKS